MNYKSRYVKKIVIPDEKTYPKRGAYYYDYYGKPVMNWLYWNRFYRAFEILDRMDLLRKNFTVLDAGCGGGIILPTLCKYYKNVFGIDYNPEISTYKNWLSANYSHNNADFVIGDVTKMPFKNNYFDMIFSFDTLEHVKNVDVAISEISRVLKPDRYVCITVPIEEIFHHVGRALYGLSEPDHYKDIVKGHEELIRLFSYSFSIIKDVVTPFNSIPKELNVFRLVIFKKDR